MEKNVELKDAKPLFSLNNNVLAAIDKVLQALSMRQRIDQAISETQVTCAQAECDQAMQDQAEAEAALVLADTREEAAEAEKIAVAATKKVEKKQQLLDREKRLVEALYTKAKLADADIQVARDELTAVAGILAEDIRSQLADRLAGIVDDITGIFKQAYAAQSVLHSRSLGGLLSNIKIPNPMDPTGQYNLLDGDRLKVGNGYVSLASEWRNDAASNAVADAFAPLNQARAKGDAHSNFVHPIQRPQPYVIRGYSMTGIDK